MSFKVSTVKIFLLLLIYWQSEAKIVVLPEDCPRSCETNLSPVCGYNGIDYQSFDNDCLLRAEICLDVEDWDIVEMLECLVRTPFQVNCPKTFDPICAYNGFEYQLFGNECYLNVSRRSESWEVEENKMLCFAKPRIDQKPVDCPKTFDPVCGFDGILYKLFDNECFFNMAKKSGNWREEENKMLCIARSGVTQKQIDCPKTFDPICASDGVNFQLFNNICFFNIAKQSEDWKQEHKMLCFASSEISQKPIDCPKTFDPICGNNGNKFKLFDNECFFNNANISGNWRKENKKACFSKSRISEKPVDCPETFEPICAYDGVQYQLFSNECFFDISKLSKNWKKEENKTLCSARAAISQKAVDCPKTVDHFCAYDGNHYKLFDNECFFNMAKLSGNWRREENKMFCFKRSGLSKDPDDCPKTVDPLCAYDGSHFKVFDNECMFNIAKQFGNWRQENKMFCFIKPGFRQKTISCSKTFKPICAYNGNKYKLFDNECFLNIANQTGNWQRENNKILCLARSPNNQKEVACSKTPVSICAYNGNHYKSFDNECLFNIAKQSVNWIREENEMFCLERPELSPKFVECPKTFDPICAYDGNHYKLFDNECFLNIAKQSGKWQQKENKMECFTKSGMSQKTFSCPKTFNPICAYDGNQYKLFDNDCFLNTAKQSGNWQQEKNKMLCFARSDISQKKFYCPNTFDPVCACNENQYKLFKNECFLNIAKQSEYWRREENKMLCYAR